MGEEARLLGARPGRVGVPIGPPDIEPGSSGEGPAGVLPRDGVPEERPLAHVVTSAMDVSITRSGPTSPSGRSSGQVQDGGASDAPRGEIAQRQVCVLEWDRSRRDLDP
jgi:hypothetical protein